MAALSSSIDFSLCLLIRIVLRLSHRLKSMRQRFHFPRTPLLIEIERRCAFSDCGAKNQIGLTKDETIEYRGFECSKCERWNHDRLNQFELPDSWAKSS